MYAADICPQPIIRSPYAAPFEFCSPLSPCHRAHVPPRGACAKSLPRHDLQPILRFVQIADDLGVIHTGLDEVLLGL